MTWTPISLEHVKAQATIAADNLDGQDAAAVAAVEARHYAAAVSVVTQRSVGAPSHIQDECVVRLFSFTMSTYAWQAPTGKGSSGWQETGCSSLVKPWRQQYARIAGRQGTAPEPEPAPPSPAPPAIVLPAGALPSGTTGHRVLRWDTATATWQASSDTRISYAALTREADFAAISTVLAGAYLADLEADTSVPNRYDLVTPQTPTWTVTIISDQENVRSQGFSSYFAPYPRRGITGPAGNIVNVWDVNLAQPPFLWILAPSWLGNVADWEAEYYSPQGPASVPMPLNTVEAQYLTLDGVSYDMAMGQLPPPRPDASAAVTLSYEPPARSNVTVKRTP